MDSAALLSKKALLRPFGSRHPHKDGREFELAVLKGLNGLGMGAQGLRGNAAAMEVFLETSARHTATISCGVSVSCYTHRRGVIRIGADLGYSLPFYKGASL
jgi:L(+)-tartrate dehydratase alpha subunit